jgi:hypothetical protein
MWRQGVRSNYRRHYWRFLWLILWNWTRQPVKLWLGFMTLLSAHHFLNYAPQVADELERESRARTQAGPGPISGNAVWEELSPRLRKVETKAN